MAYEKYILSTDFQKIFLSIKILPNTTWINLFFIPVVRSFIFNYEPVARVDVATSVHRDNYCLYIPLSTCKSVCPHGSNRLCTPLSNYPYSV